MGYAHTLAVENWSMTRHVREKMGYAHTLRGLLSYF